MFLVQFTNALGPQSVYCTYIEFECGMLSLTTARDILCYHPNSKITVQTFDKRDW